MKKAVKLIILFVILAGFFTFGLDKIAEISKDSNNKSLKTVDEIETIYVLDKDVYLQDMTDDCYEQYYQFTADLYTY